MTVPNETTKSSFYEGNDVADTFAYPFKVFDSAHLEVVEIDADGYETLLTITTHYTVTGVGDADGGDVVLTDPLAAGHFLVIRRLMPFTQATRLRNQGDYMPETHEDRFDYLTMLLLQLRDEDSVPVFTGETFADPTTDRPPAQARWVDRLIRVKEPGAPAKYQLCVENDTDPVTYSWVDTAEGVSL